MMRGVSYNMRTGHLALAHTRTHAHDIWHVPVLSMIKMEKYDGVVKRVRVGTHLNARPHESWRMRERERERERENSSSEA